MKDPSAGVKRILVVDDEPAVGQVFFRTLTREGFEVEIAINGKAAQDVLQEKEYDLIIIDIRTPVINGKQLYQFINESYPKLANRTIFTTGDVIGRKTKDFIEQRGRPFLPKPFTPDELKSIVRETLRQIKNDRQTSHDTDC